MVFKGVITDYFGSGGFASRDRGFERQTGLKDLCDDRHRIATWPLSKHVELVRPRSSPPAIVTTKLRGRVC